MKSIVTSLKGRGCDLEQERDPRTTGPPALMGGCLGSEGPTQSLSKLRFLYSDNAYKWDYKAYSCDAYLMVGIYIFKKI